MNRIMFLGDSNLEKKERLINSSSNNVVFEGTKTQVDASQLLSC